MGLQTRRKKVSHRSGNLTKKQHKPKKQKQKTKPGDNFYEHINHAWLQKTTIPPTRSVYGVSEEIEKGIEDQTKTIMEECIKLSQKNLEHPTYMESLESCLGHLAVSVETADTQHANLDTVHNVLASIQSLQSKEEAAVIMGELARYKCRGLFNIYGQYENKNDTKYTYTISVGNLGLPDPTYYHKHSLNRKSYLSGYKFMVKRLGKLFHIPQLECAIKVERILAGVLIRTENDTIEYKRTGKQLEEDFRYIPFAYLFESMGLHSWRQRIFFVESLRWLHTLNKLFHHLGLDYWKLLFSLHFILMCLPWLPPPYSDISFQFYRKQLRGQQQKLGREKQAVYVLQQYAPSFFSRLYVEKIVNKETKPQVIAMLQDFLKVAEDRLGKLEWLEPKTRVAAQEKVKKMNYIVGYPDSFEHHTFPSLQSNNILYNLLVLGEWRTNYEIQKLGQPMSQRKEWDDAVYVVNAYYYGQANEMVIPAGICNDPFYDAKRSIAWNYGGLGCILCHELTHAFDKEGKEYDPHGFQKRWWTPMDNRRYNKQAKAMIELYSKQRIYGFPVNGKRTLSENIADIGGMGMALDVLKSKLDTMKLTEDERRQAYREFFTSYATSWRMKDKKQKRIQALIMDRHAPPILRVNLSVSQFQEWYDAFDVKPGDKLYIPPEKRIVIF